VLQAVVRQHDFSAALDRTLRRRHAVRTGDDDRTGSLREQHCFVANFFRRGVAAHVAWPLCRRAAIAAQDDPHAHALRLQLRREPDRERSLAGAADGDVADHHHRPRNPHASQEAEAIGRAPASDDEAEQP
jgi:hypothetical protein